MSYQQNNLPNVLDMFRRNKRLIIICPVVAFVVGAIFFLFCPRTYQSEAQLFLRVGRESVGIDPAATAGQTMQLITADRDYEVKSAEALFKSRNVAAQVVSLVGADVVLGSGEGGAPQKTSVADIIRKPLDLAIGLVRNLDPISEQEEAIIKVERSLSVTSERRATVLIVKYKASSPQLAQTVCQAVVDVGLHEHMRVHRSEESAPFFTQQQQRLREQLDQSLEALRNAKNEMGLTNVEQRRATLESQYGAVELDRLTTNQELATAAARIDDLQKQLDEIPANLVASTKSMPNQGADLLRDRLYQLQMKAMDLEARYNDAHPLVVAVHDQLGEAKAVVQDQAENRTETIDAVNPIYQELSLAVKQDRGVVAGLKSRLAELDQQKTSVLADIEKLNRDEFRIDQLTREAELARAKYMQYAQTMEEARIDGELQNERISNISVSQPATLAEKPVSPSRMFTAAGTFLFGVGGAIALVLLREQLSAPAAPWMSVAPRPLRRRERRRLGPKTNSHAKTEALSAPPK